MTKAMRRPNIGLNRTITIPKAWQTAPIQLMETVASGRTDDGHEVLLALGMLTDGTNLAVLSYAGGARLMRAGEQTGWETETTTRGREPWERHRDLADRMWRVALDVARSAYNAARADEAGPVEELRAVQQRAVLRALTASMRNAADAFAHGAARDPEQLQAEQDRMSNAIRDAVMVGATNEQIAEAVAEAKKGCGEMQAAVLDTVVHYVLNDAPDPGGES